MKKLLLIVTIALLVFMNIRLLADESMMLPVKSASVAEFKTMQRKLDQVINTFKSSRDFGEMSAGQLINLLKIEASLVDLLLAAKTGQVVEELVVKRDGLLERSVPSIVFLYNRILDIATYDAKLYAWRASKISRKEPLKYALNITDKRAFLERARIRLHNYQNLIRDMQYEVSIVPRMIG